MPMIPYSHQVFKEALGKSIQIKKEEGIEDRVIKISEKISRGIEFSIFKLEEKPGYEIHIIVPQKKGKKSGDYIDINIDGITESEMKKLYKSFNKIYQNKNK